MSFGNRRRFSQYWSTNPSNRALGFSPAAVHQNRWDADVGGYRRTQTNQPSPGREVEYTPSSAHRHTPHASSASPSRGFARPMSAPPGQRPQPYYTPYSDHSSGTPFADACAPGPARAAGPPPAHHARSPREAGPLHSSTPRTQPPSSRRSPYQQAYGSTPSAAAAEQDKQYIASVLSQQRPSSGGSRRTPASNIKPRPSAAAYAPSAQDDVDDQVQAQYDALASKRLQVNQSRKQLRQQREQLELDREDLREAREELQELAELCERERLELEHERLQLVGNAPQQDKHELEKLVLETKRAAAMAEAISQERRKLRAERVEIEGEIRELHQHLTEAGYDESTLAPMLGGYIFNSKDVGIAV